MIAALLTAAALAAPISAPVATAPNGAAPQDAPACSFQASGEELRNRLSPPDSSSVTLEGTVVKICYGSPRKRGREIFGGLVPYGEPWRLGANEPTTLRLTGPVRVGDLELAAGSYALYAVPGEERWEVYFNSATDRWGIPITPEVRKHDVGSVTATPRSGEEAVEEMTLTLEPAEDGGATLSMAWDRLRWSLPLSAPEAGGAD